MIAEVLVTLRPGERVTLPTGEAAIVVKQQRDCVVVERPLRANGHARWTFERWQLESSE